MGTITIPHTTHLSPIEFVKKHVLYDREFCSIIDISARGNVVYAAVMFHRHNDIVLAVVVALTRDVDGWNYRDMCEAEGPHYYDCPAKILNKLSPTKEEYAIQWRAKCREVAARKANKRKLKPGSVITLETPVTFSDGVTETVFICTVWNGGRRPRKTYLRKCDGIPCRLPNLSRRAYTVQ